MRPTRTLVLLVLLFLAMSAAPGASWAQGDAPPAATTVDPNVDIPVLRLQLLPLTKDEVDVELAGWIGALKEKTAAISALEIEAHGLEGQDAQALITQAAQQYSERTALIDRVEVVIADFEAKGGDANEAKSYIDAVSGLAEITDLSSLATLTLEWAKSREGGIRWAKNIGLCMLYIVAFWIISRFVGRIVRRAVTRVAGTSGLLMSFLVNLSRKAILLVGVVLAASALEINIGPLLAAMGAVGFILAFALQDTLGNFAAGIMILMYRPFDVGDSAKVAGVSGKVVAMNLVSTTINTFDNQVVVVPNKSIWGDVITNVNGSATRRVDMVFGIGYDDDVDKARDMLESIVKSHALVLDNPAPVIQLHELADSSVNFIVRPWANTSDYWQVYWDVTREVKKRFDAEGISIPYPQQDVHVHQVSPA